MIPLFSFLENCSGIYIIINDVNGHEYIGSSVNALKRGWEHFRGKKGSAVVAAAIRKHGTEHFHAFLLERVDRADLPTREAYWIDLFDPEYNATRLTETGGRVVSIEQRQKISASLTGRKLSIDHREAIAAGGRGRIVSPETAAKIVAKLTGRKHRPESIEKMRGKPYSEDRRRKIGDAGRGRPASADTRAKRSAALKGKPWSSARRAAEEARHPDLGFVDKEYRA